MGFEQPEVFAPVTVVLILACLAASFVLYRRRRKSMTLYVTIDSEEPVILADVTSKATTEHTDIRQVMARARLYLRSRPSMSFHKIHHEMGFRMEKTYFSIKDPRRYGYTLMIMFPKGPHCQYPLSNESVRRTFCSMLECIKHTFVCPIIEMDYMSDKETVLIFRPFVEHGSLRDVLHQANPIDPCSKKYKSGTPLPANRAAIWGRQILEAIEFLQSKGYPCHTIHTGNILIEKGHVLITDYELDILGYPPHKIIASFSRAVGSKVDIAVVAFACVLYEMVIGSPPDASDYKDLYFPNQTNPNAVEIIEGILVPSKKPKFRSVGDVLKHPYFASAGRPVTPKDDSVPYNPLMIELLSEPGKVSQGRKKRPKTPTSERQRPLTLGPQERKEDSKS
eukprot:TRINITY_DN7860_c0_g2_i6.p1 TRINITY_DN7860_c0_g2~~TRINITY_DN7860_c0_g2_i6.p1  ORF type:complete len:394 (-),score=66.69 TRINITY_DN7860_c0_g2_i6:36-1217(-)